MKLFLPSRTTFSLMIAFALPFSGALAGCGRGEPESKMTSFTGSEAKADTAELFAVPCYSSVLCGDLLHRLRSAAHNA